MSPQALRLLQHRRSALVSAAALRPCTLSPHTPTTQVTLSFRSSPQCTEVTAAADGPAASVSVGLVRAQRPPPAAACRAAALLAPPAGTGTFEQPSSARDGAGPRESQVRLGAGRGGLGRAPQPH